MEEQGAGRRQARREVEGEREKSRRKRRYQSRGAQPGARQAERCETIGGRRSGKLGAGPQKDPPRLTWRVPEGGTVPFEVRMTECREGAEMAQTTRTENTSTKEDGPQTAETDRSSKPRTVVTANAATSTTPSTMSTEPQTGGKRTRGEVRDQIQGPHLQAEGQGTPEVSRERPTREPQMDGGAWDSMEKRQKLRPHQRKPPRTTNHCWGPRGEAARKGSAARGRGREGDTLDGEHWVVDASRTPEACQRRTRVSGPTPGQPSSCRA